GVILEVVASGHDGADRGNVDYAPSAGLAHRRNGGFGTEDIAQEVDTQDGVPALGAGLDDGVIHANPGVIHQNVELAKVVHGALDERGDFGFLLHVRFDEHDVAAAGRNLGGDMLATRDIPIGKGHLRAFSDEAPYGGLANPRCPARDSGHFPPELSHRPSPSGHAARSGGDPDAAGAARERDNTGECKQITWSLPLTLTAHDHPVVHPAPPEPPPQRASTCEAAW